MRTTVDLPDDLYRKAKAEAALRGVKLKDILIHGVRLVLSARIEPSPTRENPDPLNTGHKPGKYPEAHEFIVHETPSAVQEPPATTSAPAPRSSIIDEEEDITLL